MAIEKTLWFIQPINNWNSIDDEKEVLCSTVAADELLVYVYCICSLSFLFLFHHVHLLHLLSCSPFSSFSRKSSWSWFNEANIKSKCYTDGCVVFCTFIVYARDKSLLRDPMFNIDIFFIVVVLLFLGLKSVYLCVCVCWAVPSKGRASSNN